MFLTSWFYIYCFTLSGFGCTVLLGELLKPLHTDQINMYIQYALIIYEE